MSAWQGTHPYDADADGLVDADQVEQGPGSGLDADTVDGSEAAALGTPFAANIASVTGGSGTGGGLSYVGGRIPSVDWTGFSGGEFAAKIQSDGTNQNYAYAKNGDGTTNLGIVSTTSSSAVILRDTSPTFPAETSDLRGAINEIGGTLSWWWLGVKFN